MNKKLRMAGAILLSAVMMFSISAFAENSADDANIISEEMTENESSGKKVYFAGPLFNQAEKDFNLELTKVLEEYGYEVFLPQRDGIEAALLEGKTEGNDRRAEEMPGSCSSSVKRW